MKYLPWKSQTNILSEAKALQRRGIRVSETFAESRSSDGTRPERERMVGMPLIGAVSAADWG